MRRQFSSFFSLLMTVALALIVGCAKGGDSAPVATDDFDMKIASAKKLLATTPTGTQTLADLDRMTENGNVTGIKKTQTTTAQGHSGQIHQVSSGVYEIQLMGHLSPQDLAHGLAHELSHVKTEILEDPYMAAQPDLNKRMHIVAGLSGQTLQDSYSPHKDDIDFYYLSLFFDEIKAYQVNIQLQNEGIPFNNAEFNSKGLLPYIRANYLPDVLTATSSDDGATFLKVVNSYDNLVDFQKNWLGGPK